MTFLPAFFCFLTAAGLAGQAEGPPRASLSATEYDFGEVRQGQTVSHDFLIENRGNEVLRVERAELSHPNMKLHALPIAPNSNGRISLDFRTEQSVGNVEAQALIFFNDPVLPKAVLTLRGKVRPSIELRPFGAVFLAAFKDEPVDRVLTIVNNEKKPIAVKQIQNEGSHFKASLSTVATGKTYVVSVGVTPGTPVGLYEETLVIEMSSPPGKIFRIPVHLFVKPDLYATPDAVDFGGFSLEQVRRAASDSLNQTVLVTSRRDQFSILSIACDLPSVTVRQAPPSGPSRTFQIEVLLNKGRLERGPLRGTVIVKTTDPELPELRIPVQGVAQ